VGLMNEKIKHSVSRNGEGTRTPREGSVERKVGWSNRQNRGGNRDVGSDREVQMENL
jgi:hypothetical protein